VSNFAKTNSPLKNPPLQEAIFEIRFPPIEDYAIFAGGMAVSHRNDFPVVEKLQTMELPELIQVAGVIKHRFFANTRGKLFQTGSDIIAVNIINYEGFVSFVGDIKNIIDSVYTFNENIKKPNRISLRYVNNFKEAKDPFSLLTINRPFENVSSEQTKFIQIREISEIEDKIFLGVNCQSLLSEESVILDLEAFSEGIDGEWNTDMFVEWAWKAHQIIWDSLINLVSKEEMEARK
jgi:uncharacterized protein (TIGR04255 family)